MVRRPRRRMRPPRLHALPLNRLLPNILTTLALCAGLTSLPFAIQQEWRWAVASILIAGVLDGLDGRIARLLRSSSEFGAQLDSLADFVSFGVAPVLVLYLWVMHDAGSFGWLAALGFSICTALRLARFNTDLGVPDLPLWAYNFFKGVPAPAGAGLALMPMFVTFQIDLEARPPAVLVGVWVVVVAALMVSSLPTFALKAVRVPAHYIAPLLLCVALVAVLLVINPWPTLTVLGLAYLITLPFSLRRFRQLKQAAAPPAAADPEAPEGTAVQD